MARTDTLFVAIASYRDPECAWTVRDLFEQARWPDRIRVGLCWQFISPDDDACFAMQTRPQQVRCAAYDARGSLGACWAKGEAHGLRQGEDYVLQVDSHMRFHEGWDEALIELLAQCPSDRPMLSTYPAPYEMPRTLRCETPHLIAKGFDADGILTFEGHSQTLDGPRRGAFIAGGYLFARAALFDQVPYDPHLYFIGEEISFAARAFTHGWDAFSPPRCLVHHLYTRVGLPRHWENNAHWTAQNARSQARVRHLLGTEPSQDPAVLAELERYGLGTARTLAEYEAFCGVDFKQKVVEAWAQGGEFG